jgi:chorismate mutase
MITKGIRGAVTVAENSFKAIEEATLELLSGLIIQNGIKKELISHVIFTLTDDLNAEFPAKIAREKLDWNNVAMLCFHELDVPDSIKKCLRVLIVLNCEETFEPKFVYLKDAKNLRL